MKLGNYCTICTDQKYLQNNSKKVLLTLFKMEKIFENSKNSETSEPDRLRFDLTENLDLKDGFSQFKYLLHLEKHQFRIQQ